MFNDNSEYEVQYRDIETVFGKGVAIFVKDPIIGGYTAFLEYRPSVITEGETIEECIENLIQGAIAIKKYLDIKRQQMYN